MFDFEFYNPVRVVFGKNTIGQLSNLCSSYSKIMVAYGGGSIKANGVYDQVIAALQGKEIVEFSGIPANPTFEKCMEAVHLCREQQVDFVLAVGGGSVVDGVKFICSAAVNSIGNEWEILETAGAKVTKAIPHGCVLTLPATGSEMNMNAVVSKVATKEKLYFGSPHSYLQFSILDPETTYSLPPRQTANGVIDAFVHVCEQFVTKDVNTPLQDYQAIAVLKTLVQEGPKALQQPKDYNARANIMWCGTNALNHLIGSGTVQDWATHTIGHELTAFYGLDHAVTLAILLPGVWQNTLEYKKAKLELLGTQVWGLSQSESLAQQAIQKTEEFFNSLGVATKLSEHGVNAKEAAAKIYERFVERGIASVGETGSLSPDVVRAVISARA
jgi:NADP-dependent alcohol dehydrogenase